MGHPVTNLDRRTFMKLAALAALQPAATCSTIMPGTAEGVYTNKTTYRQGETLEVLASIVPSREIPFRIKRAWGPAPSGALVLEQRATALSIQETGLAGWHGAAFTTACTFDTSLLSPGIYFIETDQHELAPENQFNQATSFLSENWWNYFLVTPATPGALSSVLFLYDSMTHQAYGSFGYASIYGDTTVNRIVSANRPGMRPGAYVGHKPQTYSKTPATPSNSWTQWAWRASPLTSSMPTMW